MRRLHQRFLFLTGLFTGVYFFLFTTNTFGQQPISNRIQDLKAHGIEQYEQGHYTLASASLSEYLNAVKLPIDNNADNTVRIDNEEANYYLILSDIKRDEGNAIGRATEFINRKTNPVFRQRVAFALAQNYFHKNELKNAITYYELAGIDNLSNAEIADAKFELAYCYFNDQQFDKALPLFAAIKELPKNKYYVPGNYYYGLLAYNVKDYKNALKSFDRIVQQESYKDIVPYYQAEIYYFQGDHDKVLKISNSYLRKKGDLYYKKEMHLLTAQTLFEQNKFEEALPYFEYYYEHSDKIRKEELYELAYTYYRLEKWEDAIEKFQPLSNARDSLGQTSMYLLGDCYLKINDKKGARNAFSICSNMDFNPSQKEAASFLSAKLSYELGDEGIASRKLYEFVKEHSQSNFSNEAKTLLTNLLAKNSNYGEAFAIMSDMPVKDDQTWAIYQQVAVGRAMQLMQNNELKSADSILSLSLQQPINPNFEALSYFWKGEIAYLEKRYGQAIQFSRSFIEKAQNREDIIRKTSPNATIQNANLNIGYAQLEVEDYNAAQTAFASARKSQVTGYSDVLATDAILREADALFMQKDFSQASKLYDEAIAAGIPDSDYARFQKGLIAGQQGNVNEKIAMLNSIIQKSPPSSYQEDAQYELAITHIENGQPDVAIPLLLNLADHPVKNQNLKAKSLLSLGYAYRQNNEIEKSINSYKKYVSDYPSSPEREEALDALRNLYVSQSQPEKYADFLKSSNLPDMDETTLENTFYDAAIQDYADNKWSKAVEGFTKYLNRFPNGTYSAKAHFYRGESYFQMKAFDKALADYEAVQSDGWSEYTEDASKKSAEIAFDNRNYEKAEENFRNFRNAAMDEQSLQQAYAGLMKSSFRQDHFEEAEAFADTLLSLPNLGKLPEAEARLYKAKSLQQQADLSKAIEIYESLGKDQIGAASAEARYRVAEILLAENKLDEAEKKAVYSAQNSGGQEYWVVKSYILLADILSAQKDYFNAKATLQSVIKNAGDETLKKTAAQKLEAVKKIEKTSSKLSE